MKGMTEVTPFSTTKETVLPHDSNLYPGDRYRKERRALRLMTSSRALKLDMILQKHLDDIDSRWKSHDAEWDSLNRNMKAFGVERIPRDGPNLIGLNVGGVQFCVPRLLAQTHMSGLTSLLELDWGDNISRDASGNVFLDLSAYCFEKLIDTLTLMKSQEARIKESSFPALMVESDQAKTFGYLFDLFSLTYLTVGRDVGGPRSSLLESHNGNWKKLVLDQCPGMPVGLRLIQKGSAYDKFEYTHQQFGSWPLTLTLFRCGKTVYGWVGCWSGETAPTDDTGSKSSKVPFFMKSAAGRLISVGPAMVEYVGDRFCCIKVCKENSNLLINEKGLWEGVRNRARKDERLHTTMDEILKVEILPTTIDEFEIFEPVTAAVLPSSSSDLAKQSSLDEDTEMHKLLADSLRHEQSALQNACADLDHVVNTLQEAKRLQTVMFGSGVEETIVELNVQGRIMSTLRSTLQLCPESALSARFNEERWPPTQKDLDRHGRHILNCNHVCFEKILDVLRMRKGKSQIQMRWERWAPSFMCVGVKLQDKGAFQELVDMYFPGCQSFIMEFVEFK
ncbi:unnamed protein product [Choristocarpus tenellus]